MTAILGLWMLAMAANMAIGMHQSSSGRTQYFLFNPDGSYKYAFDTNTGGFQEQQRGSDGAVSGKYGFTGAGGSQVNVQYAAGKGGSSGYDGGSYQQEYKTSHHKQQASSYSGGGGGQGDYSMTLNPDGTYTYEYSLSDQAKAESRGADGRVKGQFSFTDPTGQKKAITYTADEGGFQPMGDHIPVADGGQGHQYSGASSYGSGASSYSSGASSYGGSSGGSGGTGNLKMKLGPGGQYEYSYSLSDQAKSEMMGADGKVKGQFSFTDPTGQNRAITYTADEGGFQPMGDHIPVADGGHLHGSGASSSYGGSYGGSSYSGSSYGSGASSYGGSSSGGGGSGDLNVKLGPGGQYEYSYSLSDQAKSEAMGADGRVKGQFSYTGKDGQKKAITYTADERGFLPQGDHIPQPSAEFYEAHQKASSYGGGLGGGYGGGGSSYDSYSGTSGAQGGAGGAYSFDYQTQDHAHSQASSGGDVSGQYSVNTDGSSQKVSYSANGKAGYNPVVEFSGSVGGGNAGAGAYGKSSYSSGSGYSGVGAGAGAGAGGNSGPGAGSYSFNYNTADHSHSQSGGGSSVSGQYSAASEGGSQKVTYNANGGYHPIVEVNTKVGGGKSSHTSSAGYGSGSGYSGSKHSSHGSSGLVGSTDHSGSGGSWSYQYTAGAHDHQEMGSNGQAQGQYNVQSAGGSQQSSYTAGKGGFMPTHDINIKLGAGGKKTPHY